MEKESNLRYPGAKQEGLMDNLARGWAIVMAHRHGFPVAVWIAILTAAMGAGFTIWAQRRQRNKKDAGDGSLRPKRRQPLPGSDKGLRP
jgi:hypothetical protein